MDEFEKFKQMTFWRAVSASYDQLVDPVSALRGDWAIEGQSEIDRQAFAERALRELYAEGLIYFFRIPPKDFIDLSSTDESLWLSDMDDIDASSTDESMRLSPEEVDTELRADWWRQPADLEEGLPSDIWFGPTEAGKASAVNPPDYVRKFFRMREPDTS